MKLKIVAELGNQSQRSLLIELPKDLIERLQIAMDGAIDTQNFISLLTEFNQKAKETKTDWMKMIFDPNAAASGADF